MTIATLKNKTPIWNSGNGTNIGTNLSGFTGLPGGRLDSFGFISMGIQGFWWTSTSISPFPEFVQTLAVYLGNNQSYLSVASFEKAEGMSVRCIRD